MKFKIITLGCKVNAYESNVISDMFIDEGYIETKDNDADIYVVNTCTVTNTAENKTIKVIKQLKEKNPDSIIAVAGCLVQINPEVVKEIPGMNIIVGNQNKSKIVSYVNEYINNHKNIIDVSNIENVTFEDMEIKHSNKTRAFVKIQDGCNNYCTYCIIPYARGNTRSKDRLSVIREVAKLVSLGHQEIVLTGIHTGNYGAEFDNYDLASLLSDILKIDGLKRMRISSIEITEINDRIINLIKDNPILVDHMHIPLQSGSNSILKAMNRKYDTKYFINKINTLHSIRPDMSITTDVIVGFPGENDQLFQETIDTIQKIKFSKLHVFPYSKKKGTVAANLDNQVDEKTKSNRVKVLLELSKQLQNKYNKQFIDKEFDVIVETYKDGYVFGHTGNYLFIKAKGDKTDYHQMIKVKINDVNDIYCLAVKVS